MTQIAVAIPPSLQKYRNNLRSFFEGMIRKLDLNSHKETPEREQVETMVELLKGELTEFEDQLALDKLNFNSLVEIQDVANYAFLIFVALRRDGTLTETELFINEFLTIVPEIGKVLCKKGRAGSKYKPGDEIQGSRRDGYIDIGMQGNYRTGVNKVAAPRSHLIWWKHTGQWPCGILDHKNRIRDDDRIANLQDVSFSDNSLNKKRKAKYPPFVTCYKPTGREHLIHYGKFVYQRGFRGVAVRAAYYNTPEEAATLGKTKWEAKVKELTHD